MKKGDFTDQRHPSGGSRRPLATTSPLNIAANVALLTDGAGAELQESSQSTRPITTALQTLNFTGQG